MTLRHLSLSALLLMVALPLSAGRIPGFRVSPFFDEQVLTFTYNGDVKVTINAPSSDAFNPAKPVKLILYALPNGSGTAVIFGKKVKVPADSGYAIQYIGAQTRFLRNAIADSNVVTAYLESSVQSWPTWRSNHADNLALIAALVDSVRSIFNAYDVGVTLSGHSGGGSFVFAFIEGRDTIPSWIERIVFLDSDYNYDDASHHGDKLAQWLNASDHHYLSVLAYNDSVALYNGQPIVSPTGGTWYRSQMMLHRLETYFTFTYEYTTDFRHFRALNGRIDMRLKENPDRVIYHMPQAELNGFIQTTLSGTDREGVGYVYFGPHAYNHWIQDELPRPRSYSVENAGPGYLRIALPDSIADSCKVYLSSDGVFFDTSSVLNRSNPVVSTVGITGMVYTKLRLYSDVATSTVFSEVLGASTDTYTDTLLIVSGFDRVTNGNTYDFIRRHAPAAIANGYHVVSATNEGLLGTTTHLSDFRTVDWILGEETVGEETFSAVEQETVKTFLRQGGRLLVTGSELGWDLDQKGSASDKDFIHTFLKAKFVYNSPNNSPGSIFSAVPSDTSIFNGGDTILFDDGTHGSYPELYPDVFFPVEGGIGCLKYSGATNYAGVSFEGVFPGGSRYGKVVTLGIPLETMYPDTVRSWILGRSLSFFDTPVSAPRGDAAAPQQWSLNQNFPNPFNPSTTIRFFIPTKGAVKLEVFDLLGRITATLLDGTEEAGEHEVRFDGSAFASGVYFYRLAAAGRVQTREMVLMK